MNTTIENPGGGTSARLPAGRPDRLVLVDQMLTASKRAGVPIRRAFVQTPPGVKGADGTRGAALSEFARDTATLDCYLWISAMASSSEPYETWYPAATWAQVAGLAESAELDAARARWSKAVTKLERLRLVSRERGAKNKVTYRLLQEDGSGAAYTRPLKGSVDGHWFSIPHTYWRDGFDLSLSAAEKLMLMVSLDQKDRFRVPTDRVPSWYGLSESTAKRGYAGLVQRGILSREHKWEEDARSPVGWRQDVYYTTEGDWSLAARDAAMKRRSPKAVVAFEDPDGVDS